MEKFEGPKKEDAQENRFSKEEIEKAKVGFEQMAQRADALIMKEMAGTPLTQNEQKELDLIFNNATVILEIIEGKIPEELK